MKKLICALLSLTLVFSLAACGGSARQGTEKEGVLRIAMECTYAPYNWTQPTDANGAVPIEGTSDYAFGYDVMMAKYLCEKLGWKLEIVKMDWDSLVPAVVSGDVDAVIAGQSITPDRMKQVDFTSPYYYATIRTLVRKDSPLAAAKSVADLDGATVTSQLGTIWYDTCAPQIPNVNLLPAQETAPSMLMALNTGACDVVVTDEPTAQAALLAYPDFVALDFTGTEGDYTVEQSDINIGISLMKGNQKLLDDLNGVLSGLTADDFTAMMGDAVKVQPLSE